MKNIVIVVDKKGAAGSARALRRMAERMIQLANEVESGRAKPVNGAGLIGCEKGRWRIDIEMQSGRVRAP